MKPLEFKQHLKPLLPTLIACCFYSSATGFLPSLPTPLKAGLSIFVVLCYIMNFETIDIKYVLFLLYLPINIILTKPDYIFRSWERLVFFACAFLAFSPLFNSTYAKNFRHQMLIIILNLSVLLSILSFLGYFLGINMMNGQESDFYNFKQDVGTFGGFYIHSMILAPFSGIATCYMLYNYFIERKRTYLYITIVLLGVLMIAASRIAFVSTIAALVFLIYKYSNNREKFIKIIVGIVLLSAITFPIWNGGLDRMERKQQHSAELGRFGTRTGRWENRFAEISSSPIIGVGFASVSLKSSEYDPITGVVEPGSSWLGIASMTGLVGFTFVAYFFYCAFKKLINSKNNESILLLSLLIFIAFHMIAEGYIFAGGSVLCVLAWLIFGCCQDCD